MDPQDGDAPPPLEHALSVFSRMRPRLFGIAYRILGSAAEAEEIVQEVWLRWQTVAHDTVLDPPGFLATITTRLAINVAQSARSQREVYVGPWLPEPVDTSADPHLGAERGEALSLAVLWLLERLPPAQRAAFVLREAFEYSYGEISEILQTSEANTRQLVSRARKLIADERRAPVNANEQERLLRALISASQNGDVSELETLLAADVVSLSDGGGVAPAARYPLVGRARVANMLAALSIRFWPGATLSWTAANGQVCLLLWRDQTVKALVAAEASAEGVSRMFWIMNPQKLTSVSSSAH
ncbi:MAG TPA: RNA polymerase sigma factor SigJ [Bryobacteraceae bacterium]|jgi:RNA polymerase sigma-70 factor (ECF subfamily)|nr:RNA polymerase sigma factor SigJ [Bryobacteraceae bacterium]